MGYIDSLFFKGESYIKKLIIFISSIILLITTYANLCNFSNVRSNDLLYENSKVLTVTNISLDNQLEFLSKIREVTLEYNIVIYKEIFNGTKSILYSSDPTLNGRVAPDNNGVLKSFGIFKKIEIKEIEDLSYPLMFGEYHVLIDDFNRLDEIVKVLELESTLEIEYKIFSPPDTNVYLYFVEIYLYLFLLFALSNVYKMIFCSREVAIRKMHGWSNLDIAVKYLLDYIRSVIIILLGIIAFISIFLYLIQYGFIIDFIFYSIKYYLYVSVLLISTLSFSLIAIYFVNESTSIKKKRNFKFTSYMNIIAKIAIIVVITNSIISIQRQLVPILNQRRNIDLWEEMDDYHILHTMYVPGMGEISEQGRKIEKSLKDFYYDLVENHEVLMIKSDAFSFNPKSRLYSFEEYMMRNKISNDEYKYKNITANEQFIQKSNILDLNNLQVSLKVDENCMNLIVPEKYKELEKNIIEEYLEYFYYVAETVPNYYNEELGRELIYLDGLEVNIIYVKNNQKYFSYNFDSGVKDNNFIIDPIVIIPNELFDSSYFYSYFGNDLFTKSEIGFSAFSNLIQKHNLEHVLRISSKKRDYALKFLNSYKTKLLLLMIKLTISSLMFLVILIFSITTYIEQNKKLKMIEKLHGYGHVDMFKSHYVLILFVYLASLIISQVINFDVNTIDVIMSMFIIEWILSFILLKHLSFKSVSELIKGG